MENEVLKAIKERRSIRRFKADQITDEELKTVLEAGTWAATGHGTQEPFIGRTPESIPSHLDLHETSQKTTKRPQENQPEVTPDE